ncbi:GNAT family N-acetyltransferase [Paenisporosarcina indica]|uniref:GNAT family N-acetyltransferase n=1 Tax=Paenisporosarcina indica TaxID=650093 RepID=UPI00094F5EA9|nr:GNAT family N-acetyltransferase [Paenisporosarcina indica]
MDIDILTVSFPIDPETSQEIQALLLASKVYEGSMYEQVLNVSAMTDPLTKGFVVLAYAEDAVLGVFSAIDMIGIHSYEWSGLVHPDFRRQGLGQALLSELQRNLELRGAESELALNVKESDSGSAFLHKVDYELNFSEATLKAESKSVEEHPNVDIIPFTTEREQLTQILMNAFGDTQDEVHTMIDFNESNPTRHIFVAKVDNEVVGTVTAVEEGQNLWVTALATDPAHQGKGVGSALLAFAQAEGKRRACQSVMLDVEIDNDKALSVYKKAGFQPLFQVDYYVKTSTAS